MTYPPPKKKDRTGGDRDGGDKNSNLIVFYPIPIPQTPYTVFVWIFFFWGGGLVFSINN